MPTRTASSHHSIATWIEKSDQSLKLEMHFPVDWDPLFRDWMTLADVYRYGTENFNFHRKRLTL